MGAVCKFKGSAVNSFHQKIYLIRHGGTEWTATNRHTGLTDIPLSEEGKEQSQWLQKALADIKFTQVFCSPLKRAKETCAITGLLKQAKIDPNLVEWNYGDYEGKTSAEIHKIDPSWTIFSKGTPHGESLSDVTARAKKVITQVRGISGDVALFSSGHFLRSLTCIWLHLPITEGKLFLLSTASLSILGYERETPVIALWNATPS